MPGFIRRETTTCGANRSLTAGPQGGRTTISSNRRHPDDDLARYRREAFAYPIISVEQENGFVARWREHADRHALDQLIGSHLRLVIKLATRNRGYGLPLEELVAEGNVGLMQAVGHFDPTQGCRFSTYATWWIRAAIQECVIRAASMVRMGTTSAQKKLFYNLRRLKVSLNLQGEGDLAPEAVSAIATALDVPADVVIEMNRRLAARDLSLNVPAGIDGDATHLDLLPSDAVDQEVELLAADEFRKRWASVSDSLNTLTARERDIVMSRTLTVPPKTLKELADCQSALNRDP